MQFERLFIENFLSIGEADVALAGRGLLLIQGRNLENDAASSNGAGKSSLVDALFWCCYGKTARGVTTDDVINNVAGKDCRVSVTIKDGPDTYEISRHRKHSKHKNRLLVSHNGTDITKGTDKQTQGLVNTIIGSTESVFANSIYAGQERMPDLPSMTDKELKALVEEAAGIDRLNAAYQAQLKKANTLKREVEQEEVELDKLNAQKAAHEDHLERQKVSHEEWCKQRDETVESAKDEAKALKERYLGMKPKELVSKRKALHEELTAILARIEATDGERKEQDRLSRLASQADSDLRIGASEVKRLAEVVRQRKAEFEGVDDLVGKPCGECGKPYCSDDLNDARALRKKAFADAAQSYKDVKAKLVDAQKRAESASKTLASFESAMTNVESERRSERETRSAIEALDRELHAAERVKGEFEAKVAKVKELLGKTSPYLPMMEDTKAEIEKFEAGIAKKSEDVKAAKRRHLIAVKASEVLGTSGVRAHILDHVTPALNDRTSHYLGQLSEGEITATWQTISMTKGGELRDKFAIQVVNDKGAKSFGGLSGGEKRKVRIATAMALQDLVSTRSAKSIPLFIFDEIDHALDADGLERLMSIMKEKATKSGTVLVISHNDMNHFISDAITVTKEGGVSRVED
ncbi:hypothetical protein TW86_03655 [Halomonas sp. S2151]|uniref:AAA family ATPase n=1 Tax=Halomonas sp. S2151 TaxID=579478 RepID=UPI0005FA1ADF|nr:AAA family ATPase [Halomonas sp. S2151]KJZ17364.1 hypothetical protein TW86_03655 [Halomonas sp. S2151]